MNGRFRALTAVILVIAIAGCANPYASQIAELDARYAAGKVSRSRYISQRHELEVQKSQVDRENAGLAIGVAAVGTAIAGTVVASQHSRGPGVRGRGDPPPETSKLKTHPPAHSSVGPPR